MGGREGGREGGRREGGREGDRSSTDLYAISHVCGL